MNHPNRPVGIDCPIELFPRQEGEILQLTLQLNQAPAPADKVPWAQEMLEAVNVLLGCVSFSEDSENCRMCHYVSNLRKRTAGVIVMAGGLNLRG